MRKINLIALLFAMTVMMSPCGLSAAQAQANKPQPPPLQIYSVHYNIYELANGKRINSRSYQLMIAAPHRIGGSGTGSVRVGNRVPVNIGAMSGPGAPVKNTFQYQNVGMDIDCEMLDAPPPPGDVLLGTIINWESVTGKDPASFNPILRGLQFRGPALVPLGKTTTIGKVDDVTSDHQYEIEVTVKKVE